MIFSAELFNLQTKLEQYIAPFAGNGYIITKKGIDRHINGIVDDVPNYFYIDWQGGETIAFDIDNDNGIYNALGQFKIIARTSGYDVESVLENILGVLMDSCGTVTLQSCSIDANYIFKNEVPDSEGIQGNLDLIQVYFEVSKFIKLKKGCTPLICKEC